MIRIALYILAILALVVGLHWLADRPGTITIDWLGYITETSVFRAIVLLGIALGLLLAAWMLLRQVWRTPAAMGRYLYRRRQKRGLDALTGGIIAVGAGDRALAIRYASQARRALPHEPLTHLLRAQAAQIGGDRATARRIFEAMLAAPDTEQLGLRGLYLEAEREGEREAARQFAERALSKNPKLGWPVEALFDLQTRAEDWPAALATLEIARRQHLIDKAPANRRRAVLLTAQAQALEESNAERASELALEAHRLAPDLIPAAAVAGRILAARGKTPRAARVLLKTWRLAPHPDLAAAYAYARPGDSPRDRLTRVRHLGRLTPNHPEAQIAIAISAIEAREWDEARAALQPLIDDRLTPRVCTLMARIEGEQNSDAGRVREWLARAVTAARDPAWTADGVTSDHWSPLSPATGALDAFQWRTPVEAGGESAASVAARLEALIGLGAAAEARKAAAASSSATTPLRPTPIEVQEAPVASAPAKALPVAPVETPAAPLPLRPAIGAPAGRNYDFIEDIGEADVPYRAGPKPAPAPKPQPAPPKPAAAAPRTARKPAEAKVFVPPRAPDDPGPDPAEKDDLSGYPTTSGAKA